LITFVIDIVALLVNFLVIWYVGSKAKALYGHPELWNRFVDEYAKKVFSFLPIGDYM
jgi:hypothetical protein